MRMSPLPPDKMILEVGGPGAKPPGKNFDKNGVLLTPQNKHGGGVACVDEYGNRVNKQLSTKSADFLCYDAFHTKNVSFYYFAIIFFPVKAEMLYFSKIGKGDQKGDHLKIYIGFNFEIFLENFKTKLVF